MNKTKIKQDSNKLNQEHMQIEIEDDSSICVSCATLFSGCWSKQYFQIQARLLHFISYAFCYIIFSFH